MQSRLLVNLALFAAVIVMSLYIFLLNDENKDSLQPISNVNKNEITSIKITHKERLVSIQKNEDLWYIVHPIKIEANQFRINSILKILKAKSRGKYPLEDVSLDKYQLDHPATGITFNDMQINFGSVNPVNGYRYISVNNYLHLIDDHYYPLLSSQVGALVSHSLVPSGSIITRLVLPDVTISKNTNGKWDNDSQINPDTINKFMSNWMSIQAFGVHDYLPRKSLGEIKVYLSTSPEPLEFVITDNDPWLIIAHPAMQLEYHFDSNIATSLIDPEKSQDSSMADPAAPRDVPAEEFFQPH